MRFDILTIFPEMFTPFLQEGVLGRAFKKGLLDIRIINIRSFARGRHKVTDDRPYGGGSGMVMKRDSSQSRVILLTPQGKSFDQSMARELAAWKHLILICGRYEGVDERVRSKYINMELSIGDYILSGGELGALVVLDAVSRLVPGVLGGEQSSTEDSFEDGLLEYPHYTRPRYFMGEEVPQVLLSGDHEKIRVWRRIESIKRTLERRPDLIKQARLSDKDRALIAEVETE